MNMSELQDIFDHSKDVMAIFDRNLRYVAANAEYCRYWDVKRRTVLGASVGDIVGEGELGMLVQSNIRSCLSGKNVHFEYWVDFPGVGRRFVDGLYSPRMDESGEVEGCVIVARDITRRKQLEANVMSERDRFESILSAINVGLTLFNRNMEVEWANQTMLGMYPKGDPRGMMCHDFFERYGEECADCPARRTLLTGKTHSRQIYLHESGMWRSFTTIPIFDSDGNVAQILGCDVDITEQQNFLHALEAREAELASIFRISRVGIGVVKNRVFTQANDFFFEMIGYSREEVIGRSSRMVYHSDEEYERIGKVVYQTLRGEDVAISEACWVRKDGSKLDVVISLTPMHPNRPEAGVTFVAMDITQHKRAQEAIRESEQRFRQIFEDVDAIAVQGYDRERRVIYWNPASERLYGFSRDEAMGKQLEDLIIPEPMREAVMAGHAAWVNQGIPIPASELELLHKDGHLVAVYSSHVMQETALGEKIMYCVDVDMSEFKRIHNKLLQAKEEAEAANRAKSEFLANMSHEIRTPLNGIQGMLSLLQKTGLDEEQREYAEAGKESAVRLNRLLSDILDISRVEAGRMAVLDEPFDLPELVKHVCELFRLSYEDAGIELVRRVDENLPNKVVGDSARLQQVLTNLVGNALKYTDSGGVRVEVCRLTPVESGKERILFSVFDTGIGISREVLESLFEPFIQGSRGYARQYQGAGLGLSICKRLVDLMDGHMAVESTPGEGSVFHVALSFGVIGQETDVKKNIVAMNDDDLPPLRVLIAEDDKVNRIVGRRLLESIGCSVEVAVDGNEVLDKVRQEAFDAVFMDVQMPGMDGMEATAAIRAGETGEDRIDMPIFAMTAYTMAGDRERLMAQGVDGYIPKPVEMEDLVSLLHQAADRKQAREV